MESMCFSFSSSIFFPHFRRGPPLPSVWLSSSRRHPHGRFIASPRAVGATPSSDSPGSQSQNHLQKKQLRTLFPGGFKRAEIKVPSFVLSISAEAVLSDERARDMMDATIAKGVVGIVLLSSVGEGGELYEAACSLKELVRERAYLVIEERVDIAAAVGANGVLLSDQGLPAIVARNMMSKSTTESVLLPLVGRNLGGGDTISGSRYEGADFLVIETEVESCLKNVEKFVRIDDAKIPFFLRVTGNIGGDLFSLIASRVVDAGASGMLVSMYDLDLLSDDIMKNMFSSEHWMGIQRSAQLNSSMGNSDGNKSYDKRLVAGFTKLSDEEITLVEEERHALLEAVSVMQKAVPLMNEISLLMDAIAWLDQPFLLAVVGEFNSGKSSVINALLGKRCLREGVVPTTNEVTFLCYSDKETVESERCERHPDGQLMCYLPSPILKEMNIVDTPGTNVILQRQQSLTEEFIPRADLVLFVLSSDRPLTETEVAFLLYIRQWKKNVLFVLNKSDLYSSTSELEEAIFFVKDNVGKLLTTRNVILFPVSARLALEAKHSMFSFTGTESHEHLLNDPRWKSSGFLELENFLFSFLDGSTNNGKMRKRFKLETPIAVAERLLISSEKLLQQEYEMACEDLFAINNIINSAKQYAMRMQNESASWRRQALSLVAAAKTRTVKLAKSILLLSNIDLLLTYALRTENSRSISAKASIHNEIISSALSDAQTLLEEYCQWLQVSASEECHNWVVSFDNKWPGSVNDKTRCYANSGLSLDKGVNLSQQVMQNFSASAASRLFEQEIREVALGTYGGLGAAGLSASLLTSILPTTLEDLLALGLCSAGGFLAVSTFPARRKRVIEKVERVADGLAQQMEQAMQEDLSKTAKEVENYVVSFAKPYKDSTQQNMDRITELKKEIALVEQKLKVVKTKIQNLHTW